MDEANREKRGTFRTLDVRWVVAVDSDGVAKLTIYPNEHEMSVSANVAVPVVTSSGFLASNEKVVYQLLVDDNNLLHTRFTTDNMFDQSSAEESWQNTGFTNSYGEPYVNIHRGEINIFLTGSSGELQTAKSTDGYFDASSPDEVLSSTNVVGKSYQSVSRGEEIINTLKSGQYDDSFHSSKILASRDEGYFSGNYKDEDNLTTISTDLHLYKGEIVQFASSDNGRIYKRLWQYEKPAWDTFPN
jgi:hypothetical protein